VCSSRGNLVRVTFHDVDPDVGFDGDVPSLTLDKTNSPLNHRTFLEDSDGTFLKAVLSGGQAVSLPTTTTEETKGVKYEDRRAAYVSGDGTPVLRFKYTVQQGDSSEDLEASIIKTDEANYVHKLGAVTTLIDTTSFPTSTSFDNGRTNTGSRYRYMSSTGSSLSFKKDISIDTSTPTVVKVAPTTGYDTAGSYGAGQNLYITIHFSADIEVYHHNAPDQSTQPYLLLETGATNRKAYYLSHSGPYLNLLYTVQPGDASADLDYFSTSSLVIPTGSYIRRKSTTPTSDVDATLPATSASNSLSDSAAWIIDTTAPKVYSVKASTSLNAADVLGGTKTLAAGDEVYINVLFNNPVSVNGSPRIYVNTEQASLDDYRLSHIISSNGNRLRLPKGFSPSDFVGKVIKIQVDATPTYQYPRVDQVDGDFLVLSSAYTGPAIDDSVPLTYIYPSGYQPAEYVSGSATDTLVFKYIVQPGDHSSDLRMHDFSSIELDGSDWIRRTSTSPTTSIDATLPTALGGDSVQANSAIVINTDVPQVLQVSTTKRSPASYSQAGEKNRL
jgi:hypothetical protein